MVYAFLGAMITSDEMREWIISAVWNVVVLEMHFLLCFITTIIKFKYL